MARPYVDEELRVIHDGVVIAEPETTRHANVGVNSTPRGCRLLHAGLGRGDTRRELARLTKELTTVDNRQELVETWREERGDPGKRWVDSPENKQNRLMVADVIDELIAEAERPLADRLYDSVFVDVASDMLLDDMFQEVIREVLPGLAQRLVFVFPNPVDGVIVPGFSSVRHPGSDRVWLLDRYDPSAGIGEHVMPGHTFRAFEGWVPWD